MHPMVRGELCEGSFKPEGRISLRGTHHRHLIYVLV